jgi:hypothetical protein
MGLIRGIARTAAVAGTATAVSNRVSRRQGRRWDAHSANQAPPPAQYPQQTQYPQQAPYPPPQYPPPQYPPPQPAAPAGNDLSTQLAQLTKLRDQGVLTDQEFAAAKAKLLGI